MKITTSILGTENKKAIKDMIKFANQKSTNKKKEQKIIKTWLCTITEGTKEEKRKAHSEIKKTLGKLKGHGAFIEHQMGVKFDVSLKGLKAYAFCIVLIMSDNQMRKRIGYCKMSGCGEFQITFKGKPRKFCNDMHRLAYDKSTTVERVKKHRKKKKEQKAIK